MLTAGVLGVGLAGQASARAAKLAVCPTGCAYRDIQPAINAAQNGDTIMIAAGTYGPANTGDKNLKLLGAGGKTTITGGGTSRVISIGSGAVTISGVTITGGHSDPSDPNQVSCSYSSCGGGIFSDGGTVMIKDSTISDNAAWYGGGIFNRGGVMTLTDSAVTGKGNSPSNVVFGGGIYNDGGTLTLKHSTVADNRAWVAGGGIEYSGTVTLVDSTVTGNRALSESGGGIYGGGTLTLKHSTVAGNWASRDGGGLRVGGTATLKNSTVADNTGQAGEGGGIWSDGTMTLDQTKVTGNGAFSSQLQGGGGIFNYAGTLTLKDSTIADNTGSPFGGGIYNYLAGTVTLRDSSVTGNTATPFGPSPSFGGGGIYNPSGTVTLKHSTASCNTPDEVFGSYTEVNSTPGGCV